MSVDVTKRVLLIGWDAADWKVIHPLLDAGKMPFLNSMVETGVMGNMATLRPILSPMLWTSIATGKRPYKHGIHGFIEPRPDGSGVQPVTNLSRKAKAVWNILNQEGFQSNVVGWWPSHPAEPLNGVMVSNHFQRALGPIDQPWPIPPGSVYPAKLAGTLAEYRLNPNELELEHVAPFIPKAAEIDQEKDKRLASCMKIIAECTSVHGVATWLMENEPWDLMAVYYDAIDHFCHGFMRYHPPRRDHIPERDFELYHDVVEAAYRYHDLMLGRLLELAGEDATVILVSDHGFHPDDQRPRALPQEPAGPAIEHRDFGIFVMKGSGIKQDQNIFGVSLLDVTPTILTFFGLPIGDDMDGRSLVDAFEQPHEVASIGSWEDVEGNAGCHSPEFQLDPVESQEAIKQLVELGYIDQPDGNARKAVANALREQKYNLARAYMDGNRQGEAVPILEELYQRDPDEYRFGVQLASCLLALDRTKDLRPLVDEMVTRRVRAAREARKRLQEFQELAKQRKDAQESSQGNRSDAPDGEQEKNIFSVEEQKEIRRLRGLAQVQRSALDYLQGCICISEGNGELALQHLRRALKADKFRPGLHLQIGEAYLKVKKWDEAEQSFQKALEIDPDTPSAHVGLARCDLARRRNKKAGVHAVTAIGMLYAHPMAHYCLGVALHRLGRIPRAIDALQVAVTFNPNFREAHERLAYIYQRRLGLADKAAEHQAMVRKIRAERKTRRKSTTTLPDLEFRSVAMPTAAKAPSSDSAASPAGAKKRSGVVARKNARKKGLITVVSGLPRSGTSMILQMLRAGGLPVLTDGQRMPDEDNPNGYLEYDFVKRLAHENAWLDDAVGKSVKIIAQLLRYLPVGYDYKVIFMERDLDEVIASQTQMLHRQARQGANLGGDQLRRVFGQQVGLVKRFLAQRQIGVLYVGHRDAIDAPSDVARRVREFLGVDLDESLMAGSIDSNLYRQRS